MLLLQTRSNYSEAKKIYISKTPKITLKKRHGASLKLLFNVIGRAIGVLALYYIIILHRGLVLVGYFSITAGEYHLNGRELSQ